MKWVRGAGVADILVGLLVVAGIYVLVRPSSPGPELINNVVSMVVAVVKQAADLGNQ